LPNETNLEDTKNSFELKRFAMWM